jgi:hypothetical protein
MGQTYVPQSNYWHGIRLSVLELCLVSHLISSWFPLIIVSTTSVILLENVIVAKVPVMYPFSIPPEWIACLTVSRMMMNIRGLIFDDPHGTEGIEFSAIEFRVPPHSSDPTENEAEDYMETPEIGPESHLGCSSHV